MRHQIAFRKLSRTASHRDLMLRNMVSSLLQHEQIHTTLPKAKEASRVAEWVIGWGKGGSLADKKAAEAFLMNPQLTVPKLFQELSHRYAGRNGGYTRVHKFGHRKGDHAPNAILELVDNPNDLKFGMTAKAIGRELARLSMRGDTRASAWAAEQASTTKAMSEPRASTSTETIQLPAVFNLLQYRTRLNAIKAIKFRQLPDGAPSSLSELQRLAREAFFRTTAIGKIPEWSIDEDKAEDIVTGSRLTGEANAPITVPGHGRKIWAGQENITESATFERIDTAAEELELADLEAQRQARFAELKRKMRHPEGRNGINRQSSALRRAKGVQFAPRTLAERRFEQQMSSLHI